MRPPLAACARRGAVNAGLFGALGCAGQRGCGEPGLGRVASVLGPRTTGGGSWASCLRDLRKIGEKDRTGGCRPCRLRDRGLKSGESLPRPATSRVPRKIGESGRERGCSKGRCAGRAPKMGDAVVWFRLLPAPVPRRGPREIGENDRVEDCREPKTGDDAEWLWSDGSDSKPRLGSAPPLSGQGPSPSDVQENARPRCSCHMVEFWECFCSRFRQRTRRGRRRRWCRSGSRRFGRRVPDPSPEAAGGAEVAASALDPVPETGPGSPMGLVVNPMNVLTCFAASSA